MLGLKIGIDFGSAVLNICVAGRGTVVSEPSVMLCDAESGKPLAMGKAAVEMLGRTPSSLKTVLPVRDGVVDNLEAAQQMLRPYITLLCGNRLFKPNVLIGVPTAVTRNEKRALLSILTDCGCGRVCFIEKPLAAAIGAKEDSLRSAAVLCADIGAGSTDAALISMGSICASAFSRTGGRHLTAGIRRYLQHTRGYEVGFLTAEEIKKQVGGAMQRDTEVAVLVNGKNTATGLPETFEVTSTELYWVLRADLEEIAKTVLECVASVPDALLPDVMRDGILLTGGAARLFGMRQWLAERTDIPVHVAQEPERAVINGLNLVLKDVGHLFSGEYVYPDAQISAGGNETVE